MHRSIQSIWAFVFSLIVVSSAYAWDKITTNLDLSCKQSATQLNCDYRTLDGTELTDANARYQGQSLPITTQASTGDNSVAVLFLVDTSDPGRQVAINKKKQHIQDIQAQLEPAFSAGLASFDKSLRILAPIGESAFLLKRQLDQLRAVGRTTELYRNVIEAMETLASYDADTKIVFLLSDGQAEDKAYFHSDVIRVARQAGIIINSIGYPRSVSLSVALQTLRRLSEETGGHYVETSANFDLPGNYLQDIFRNIRHTGSLSINLESVASNSSVTGIKFTYTTGSAKQTLTLPVQPARTPTVAAVIPDNASQPTIPAVNTTADSVSQPVTIVTRQADSKPINLWLWYGIPAAFIIIIIFILITLFLLWQRPGASSSDNSAPTYEYRPYAYLLEDNNDKKRHPITRTIWRIGRGKDNELMLDDSSISRRHAEIHRNVHGSFDIIDMNSMNGVYINGEKIGKAMLQEGDEIEIGDILLKFSQFPAEYAEEDSTVMQKTKTPEVSIS